jgi:hypothetical protein
LHQAALAWLNRHDFHAKVFLELTKADKLARIAAAGCTHFIDDLPEFLNETDFPENVRRILFDPNDRYRAAPLLVKYTAWDKILTAILAGNP